MKNLKILINIFNQPEEFIKILIENNKNLYIPINGGSLLQTSNDNWNKNNLYFDNIGDNISNLNPKLNELTSVYWFWKNMFPYLNTEYIGFNHYRRFFKLDDFYNDIEKYDILIADKFILGFSLYNHYKILHNIQDLEDTKKILLEKYSFENIDNFMNRKMLYAPCNMYIMKRDLFNEYCTFIFSIVLRLERIIKLDESDKYQYRALAFLSERLTSFWMTQKQQSNNYKIKEIPMYVFKNKNNEFDYNTNSRLKNIQYYINTLHDY